MKILAIETTGAKASVAVRDTESKNNSRIYCDFSENEMNHLQALFPMIQGILDDAHISRHELDLIAVSKGPGSFTGIRIGMAAAKTMAQALGLPMASVPTLESFAYAKDQAGIKPAGGCGCPVMICPMLDARRRQLYAAAYIKKMGGSEYKEAVPAGAYSLEDFLHLSIEAAKKENISFIRLYGDGVDSYEIDIKEEYAKYEIEADAALPDIRYQSAAHVLMQAEVMAEKKQLCTYNDVKPDYMRESEAERKLAAGQLGKKKSRKKLLKKEPPAIENEIHIPAADEKISYRKAAAGDADGFAKLDARCFSHAWTRISFDGELDGSKESCYVAAENSNDELVGFAGAAYVIDEGEVNRVAVHPMYRGRGIAGHMLDILIKDADSRGVEDLMLEVREANREAIALYKDHGFAVEGRRNGYYAETGENALLMRRKRKEQK